MNTYPSGTGEERVRLREAKTALAYVIITRKSTEQCGKTLLNRTIEIGIKSIPDSYFPFSQIRKGYVFFLV